MKIEPLDHLIFAIHISEGMLCVHSEEGPIYLTDAFVGVAGKTTHGHVGDL